ncbi:MAG: isoprenylcysteine carboxylmethyltransferase family protein [Candidatus Sulfotelmatobacter sp.]
MIWKYLFEGPWVVIMAYWALAALKTQRTRRKERFVWRYGIVFMEVVGFTLMFDGDADIGVFGHKVFPRIFGVTVAGIILVWAGIALAIWARWHLGQYWSGRITIKEDHKLIRTGPYARLRHPIYSGLDLAVIGSTIAIDHWRCVAGACIIILGFWVKAKREEAMLSGQFGTDFEEHRRHTGFLFPRLKVSS